MPLIDDLLELQEKRKKFTKNTHNPWGEQGRASNVVEEIIKTHVNDKVDEVIAVDFERTYRNIFGVQKNVLYHILRSIEKYDDLYGFSSPISTQDLVLLLKASKKTIQDSFYKLKKAGLVESYEKKTGRGGYACYKIKKEFAEFVLNKM